MDGFNCKKLFLSVITIGTLLGATLDSVFSMNVANDKGKQLSDEVAHEIVFNGSPDDVKKLLQSGYDVNRVSQCNTLLSMAVNSSARGKNARKYPSYALEKIKILVGAGADVNFIPCQGKSMSALHWAVSLPSQLEYMEIDVNKAIDEKIKNKIGECNFPGITMKPCGDVTAEEREKIRTAIKGAMNLAYKTFVPYFMEIIDYLAANGSNINLKSGELNTTPMHRAASNPQEITIEPLKYLIEKGADIDVQDIDGNTPLFVAYGTGNTEAVRVLINAGADINIKNKEGASFNEVKARNIRGLVDKEGNVTFDEL